MRAGEGRAASSEAAAAGAVFGPDAAGAPGGGRAGRGRRSGRLAVLVLTGALTAVPACSQGAGSGDAAPTSTAPADPSGSVPAGRPGTGAPGTGDPGTAGSSGVAGRAAVARAAAVADGLVVHRVVAEGDVVVVHAERPATGTAPAQAVVTISTFGPDGAIHGASTVEQPVPATSANGHTMFDGGGDPVGSGDPVANGALVRRLYDEVFVGRDVSVVDELVAPGYTQHNAAVPDGAAGLKALAANGLPVVVEDVIAQGDLVAGIVTYAGVPAVDLFRIEDGRIVEHWDVLGRVPAR